MVPRLGQGMCTVRPRRAPACCTPPAQVLRQRSFNRQSTAFVMLRGFSKNLGNY